jgi:general secretion pathway protein K
LVEGGKLSNSELAKFARLYGSLKLPPEELATWSQEWLRSRQAASGPLQPKTIQNLDWVGLSAKSVKALGPYITLLPNKTPINLNTASAIVIHAALGGVDITQAERWVVERLQTPLRVQADASAKLGLPSNSINTRDADITSSFFEVSGRLRLGDWVIEEKSLVQRIGQDVKTIWRSRLL